MTNKTCSVAYLFDSLIKHYGVAGLCKPDTATEFKALGYALSGAFILIQLQRYGLKCATLIQACNLPSFYELSRKKILDW